MPAAVPGAEGSPGTRWDGAQGAAGGWQLLIPSCTAPPCCSPTALGCRSIKKQPLSNFCSHEERGMPLHQEQPPRLHQELLASHVNKHLSHVWLEEIHGCVMFLSIRNKKEFFTEH